MNTPFVALSLSVLLASCAATPSSDSVSAAGAEPVAAVMTPSAQEGLTPEAVLADLQAGNRRFVEGRATARDYRAQAAATATGQYPKAVVLGCLDSRVPPEIVFDQGIGDLFVGRIAGNFENTDMLGSLEFATKAAGSKLIVVLGHTKCGAIKGAADGVELGNLTAMLRNFDGALERAAAETPGPRTAANAALVQAAVVANVRQTMADIVAQSPVIAELVGAGQVAVVGGVYDLATGRVDWLD